MFNFHKGEPVYTADGQHLGDAHLIYHRLNEILPDLQQYAAYLYVVSFDIGDDYYVPTDFIKSRDPETGKIVLKVKLDKVNQLTWTRLPEFIPHDHARCEELPLVE